MKKLVFLCGLLALMVACGDDDNELSIDDNVTVTGVASDIGFTTAKVEGKVSLDKITANSTSMSVEVQYSETTGNWYSKEADVEPGGKVSLRLTDLSPETEYYYRTCVRMNGINYVGDTRSFTTKPVSNIVKDCRLVQNDDDDYHFWLEFQLDISKDSPDASVFLNNPDCEITVGIELSLEESHSRYEAYYSSEEECFVVRIDESLQGGKTYNYRPYTCYEGRYACGEYKEFTTKDNNTIIEILDWFLVGDDLTNTAWLSADSSYALEFQTGSQGYLYYIDYTDQAQSVAFSYSITNDNETSYLTLNFSDATWKFNVVEFEANKVLVLNDSGGYLTTKGTNITFRYYSGEE